MPPVLSKPSARALSTSSKVIGLYLPGRVSPPAQGPLVWANIPCKNGAIMSRQIRTPADRQRAADVRDWAAANGLELKDRGRIPAAVYAAYDAATAEPDGPAEPAPDWGAAGADLIDLDVPPDPDLEPPGGVAAPGPQAGEPPRPPQSAEPPPASLDDARARLAAGRAPRLPSWAGGRGGGATQRPAAPPVKITPAL